MEDEAADRIGELERLREQQSAQDDRDAAAIAAAGAQAEQFQQRIADLEAALADREAELERLGGQRREYDEHDVEALAAAGAQAEQLRQRIAELEDQAVDRAAELERLQALQNAPNDAHAEAFAAAEAQAEALQQRIAELETAQDTDRSDASVAESEMLGDLRRKARQLSAVSEHLERRRARLQRYRFLLHVTRDEPSATAAPTVDMETHASQMRQFEEERRELAETKRMLGEAERRMMRRWARPRAVVAVGWLTVLGVIAAGASWFAAGRIAPAVVSASVRLEAKDRSPGELSEEAAERWRSWHAQLLHDQGFRQTLAKRMKERRLDAYADPDTLSRRLDGDLALDTDGPESIVLTLAGTDAGEVEYFLDILATTVAAESTRQIRRRTGEAWAVVDGERKVNGRLCYASLNPQPIRDDRLKYAAAIFGPAWVAILLLVGLAYLRLIKAKREFDEDGALFEAAETAQATTRSSL